MFPEISEDPEVQKRYEAMRRSGESHTIAEMLACQQVPCLVTDSTFMRNSENGRQFDGSEHIGDAYAAKAKAAGVSITGKKYLSSIANEPGDVEAWVSGRGDVQRVCEQRGWNCDGAVKVKGRAAGDRPDKGPYEVADDIIDAEAQSVVADNGGTITVGKFKELKHEIAQKRKPAWSKK